MKQKNLNIKIHLPKNKFSEHRKSQNLSYGFWLSLFSYDEARKRTFLCIIRIFLLLSSIPIRLSEYLSHGTARH